MRLVSLQGSVRTATAYIGVGVRSRLFCFQHGAVVQRPASAAVRTVFFPGARLFLMLVDFGVSQTAIGEALEAHVATGVR